MSSLIASMVVQVQQHHLQAQTIREQLKTQLVGKNAKIISKHWNGQPIGRSRKKLFGAVRKITDVMVSDGEVWLQLDVPDSCYIEYKDVEVQ